MGDTTIQDRPGLSFVEDFSDEEHAILQVIDTESAAYFANDYDTLAAQWLQTDKAVRIFSGPRVGVRQHKGWDEIGAGFRKSMEWAPQHFDAREYLVRQNTQISVSGDIAWVHYDQILAKNDPSFITDALQHETKILHRVDGTWRIACMILIVPEHANRNTPEIRLDETARIVELNETAKARIAFFDGLKVVGDRVHARKRDFDPGFQNEVQKCVAFLKTMFAPNLLNRSAHPIPLGEDDYSRPMFCWVRVVQSEISITFEDYTALEGWIDNAAALYALSPSQRRLVTALSSGLELREIADDMGVQLSTIRTQLRRVFEKTGTSSQSALVACLMSIRKPG